MTPNELAPELRQWLLGQTQPLTYGQVIRSLMVGRITILTQALEILMEEDAVAGRPLLSARVVSRTHPLPNRGFFDCARRLGLEVGDEASFHLRQLADLGLPPAKG